ncbi:MAG TPA: CHAT domain-containing protein, partial [Rhodocyclaceae bacterium]|nr:CHAT domain-containing protein [Rhodocyclaceae bacterium]
QYEKVSGRNIDWALVLVRTGKASDGAEMLRRLLSNRRRAAFADPLEVAQLRGYLGVALTAAGQNEAALAEFQAALPALLKQGSDDAGSENGGYFRVHRLRTVLEGYLELLAGYHARGNAPAGLDPVTESFRMADVARGSSVQRALLASVARANLPDPALAELARREQDASSRLQSLNTVMIRLASAPASSRLDQVIADMRADMQRLEEEQGRLRRELEQRFPDYANLINPRAPSPAALQSALRGDEAMVAFYVTEERSYVWTIGKQALSWRILDYPWREHASDAARLREGLDLGDGTVRKFDYATAHKVYRQLLEGDSAAWSQARVLNIVPHGPLAQVPFSVLLTDAPKGSQPAAQPWLMQKTAIAQQASGSAWLALRQAPARTPGDFSFVGFGDPVFAASATKASSKVRSLGLLPGKTTSLRSGDGSSQISRLFDLLAPLPDTAVELNDIAGTVKADRQRDLYIGKRASEANVKQADLKRYRIVAFATHGLTPAELPELDQPALALSNPALSGDTGNDGLLTLEEILALKLDADWVVLSACNTASPDGIGGEAISGLGRGFFFAGARSLLVSNWAVETVSARLLTTTLFRQQAANPGLSRAEALQAAMQTVMRDKSGNYAHPAFWAPFSVVGDGGR